MEESQDTMLRSLITLAWAGTRSLWDHLTFTRFKKRHESRFGKWDVAHAKQRRRAARASGAYACCQPVRAKHLRFSPSFVRQQFGGVGARLLSNLRRG